MARTGKNSPLGVNVTGSILNNTGYTINKVAASYMGESKSNDTYTPGKLVTDTCLRSLMWAFNDAVTRRLDPTLNDTTYNNLMSIGTNSVPALGNSPPSTYVPEDPSGIWTTMAVEYGKQNATAGGYDPNDVLPGPATSGYGNYDGTYGDPLQGYGLTDQKQNATWYPWNVNNPNIGIMKYGWIRCFALQAWNEFNWNGSEVEQVTPNYSDFCSSFTTANSYIQYTNQAIIAANKAETFLEGTYSNMDDLTSADISGISLSSKDFGTDMINLGKAFNTNKIDAFGLPSTLLATLGVNNAITPDLSFALLAAGLSSDEISLISSGSAQTITTDQERKIYGAFLIITGENLAQVLAPLQCTTQGLVALADLLNVKKMFPNSYSSLTVPKYNAQPGPTNSKTYYLIYEGDAVNGALDSPEMKQYVGLQVPKGTPPKLDRNRVVSPENYEELPIGFGAYARGIIPEDQAIAAGALSFTMRQVRKVESIDFKKFSKISRGIENMLDLTLTAGTSKPTNQEAIDANKVKGALGSGPYGSYTMSDFFGCMSGLPYPWKNVYNLITDIETTKLYSIYSEMYLGVAWEGAVLSYTLGSNSPSDYFISSISIVSPGGGYGRGGAPAPVISLPYGASATCTIGTDPNDIATFGKVVSVNLISGGSHTNNIGWYADIECPPTATLPVLANGDPSTGGTNTPSGTVGWPTTMSNVVQAYIDQANTEIVDIQQQNLGKITLLNQYWDSMGAQLKIEQRARYTALTPVSIPKDLFLNPMHSTTYNFVDTLPALAQDTRPHMSAQTLEAISDLDTLGGQSTVGAMRQERNQRRLESVGIDLDNDIPDVLSEKEEKLVTTNGTMPGAITGTGIPFGDTGIEYTIPAWPANIVDGVVIEPEPSGIFIPEGFSGTFLPVPNGSTVGTITPILQGKPYPVVSSRVPLGTADTIVPINTPTVNTPIIQPPAELDPTNLSPNLNPNFMSSTLLPATPNVAAAIDQVIKCNCDCWIN